jgi:DNA-binding transcriptional regulator YdaS (Cro superfamily)
MGKSMKPKPQNGSHLLHIHKLHLGLYARVADRLGVSPSYVSLVANGVRQSEKVHNAIVKEIARIHSASN